MRYLLVVITVLVAVATAGLIGLRGPVPVARADISPSPSPGGSLAGEQFTGSAIQSHCATTGDGTVIVEFVASGVATGPVPGSFREEGVAMYDSTDGSTLVRAHFQINSPTGNVTGSKFTNSATIACSTDGGPGSVSAPAMTYEVKGAIGGGTASMQLTPLVFSETFTS